MAFQILKNEADAAARRIPFVLVDATDFSTPEDIVVTGVKVSLSFAGGATGNSTNDIVKVDGAKGMYYIELTQAEADTAIGAVHGYLKPTGCAASYPEGEIVDDVPTSVTAILSRLPAALVGGRIDASVGAMSSGVLTAASIAADAITAAKIADGAIDAATFAANALTASKVASDLLQAIAQEVLLTLAMHRGNKVRVEGSDIVVYGTDGVTEISRQPFTRLLSSANPIDTVG